MKKTQVISSMIPNIYELGEVSFLKREIFQWYRFKDKEKFIPLFRGITYQCKDVMSKMYVFSLGEQKKDKKVSRFLEVITEKEIISLQEFYQILNENANQKQFSDEVERIKTFEKGLYAYVGSVLSKNFIKFVSKQDYLNFNVYKVKDEFYLKGSFNNYNYQIEFSEQMHAYDRPEVYKVNSCLVKQELQKKYNQLQNIVLSIPLQEEIHKLYKRFYEDVYFFYDQFVLKLQVFNNYPILRLKNFVPIKFRDEKTGQALEGPIFSNANPQCMYAHFLGYNADSTKLIQGEYCQHCQIFVQQLQENELLMMLRDNIFNPEKMDVFYCPEYNRFKLLSKIPVAIQSTEEEIGEKKVFYRSEIKYLNYSHFRTNLKKMTTKNRLTFVAPNVEQYFGLSFSMLNKNMMIIDPARGRYCQHFAFTDLRLYYMNYDVQSNLYTCPVQGCDQKMVDADILFLKEVVVLIEFAKFKCQKWQDLAQQSKVIIDNTHGKLYVEYKVRDQGTAVSQREELVDFYKTLVDPYVPFPEYTLGLKQKQRKQRLDEYMFGGLREEMRAEEEVEEEEDQFYQND